MDTEDKVTAIVGSIAATVGILAFFALLWGMFVYNHVKNVERDKYYADHCVTVENSAAIGQKFKCESSEGKK